MVVFIIVLISIRNNANDSVIIISVKYIVYIPDVDNIMIVMSTK